MKYLKIFLVGLLLLFLVFGFLSISRVVKIKDIECKTSVGECEENIRELMRKYENKSYYLVKKGISSNLQNNKNIESYRVNYVPLNKVSISINERIAKYILQNKDSQEFTHIDKDGFVVASNSEKNLQLKLLTSEALPQKGAKVSEKMLFALKLLTDLSLTFQVNQGIIENDSLLIELPSAVRVIFPLDGEREVLVGGLVLVQDELNSSDNPKDKELKSGIKIIDMRFKNPVLRKS